MTPKGIHSTSANTGSAVTPTPTSRPPPAFDHTAGTPREAQARIRLTVLRVANRFRQVRMLEVAAALAPEREYKAALSAAQRAVGRLVADKQLTRYRSLSGQTYYGLTKRGADFLRDRAKSDEDSDALASASRACEKTNPEHALWAAFTVLGCEARGMPAQTEVEFARRFAATQLKNRTFPLSYAADDGKRKGLMPDAISVVDQAGVVWFEIDRSARGSARCRDLKGLVDQIGTLVNLGNGKRAVLRKVVVLCKTPGILRRDRTYLTGSVRLKTGELAPRIRAGGDLASGISPRGSDVFDIHKDVVVTVADGAKLTRTVIVGQVHLQLLPTHLSSYTYKDGAAKGWFDDGSLPFINTEAWPRST